MEGLFPIIKEIGDTESLGAQKLHWALQSIICGRIRHQRECLEEMMPKESGEGVGPVCPQQRGAGSEAVKGR